MTDEQRLEQDMNASGVGSLPIRLKDHIRRLLSQLDDARQQIQEVSQNWANVEAERNELLRARVASEQREKRLLEALELIAKEDCYCSDDPMTLHAACASCHAHAALSPTPTEQETPNG